MITFANRQTQKDMKRLNFILTIMLVACSMSAQTSAVRSSSNGEATNIDNTKYRITYEGKWVNNPSSKPFIYTESEMRLDIGEKATYFYDRTKQVRDSLMEAKVKTGDFDFSNLPKGGRFPFSYYKNYPAVGKSLQLETVGRENYQCTETVEIPDWQVVPDSTADIMGCHCQLAKTNFKGRTWYAWYAEDIPMQEGPWKLCGLPGLILKAYDEGKEYVFTVIGMNTITDNSPITIGKEKREEISQKKLKEAKDKFTPGMLLESMSKKTIKAYDEKGNAIDLKKLMNKKNVFNPIEQQ